MKFIKTAAVAFTAISLMTACDDTDSIGSSLLPIENSVVVDDSFTIRSHSVPNEQVQSRTVNQLIGDINAKGYGQFHSDFVTQFMPAATLDSTLTSSEAIDSVKLLMMFSNGSFVGDSVIPMGLEVYRLKQDLQAPIFSDFNPEGYYDESAPLAKSVYGASDFELPDSIKELGYKSIAVELPRSLGVELYDLYKSNPAAYLDPNIFSRYFKGLYVKSSYGSGRVTTIQGTLMQFYYHLDGKTDAGSDTTYNYVGNFYSVGPEVITNNNINYVQSDELTRRVEAGENIIVAPAGIDVELEFPLQDVINSYRRQQGQLSVINDLTLSIPATKISNDYSIQPPQNLLIILKNKRQEFFEKSKITDGKTSFYATYNSTTSSYVFNSMRQYLIDAIKKNTINPDDYTFVITPVTISFESSSSYYDSNEYISSIVPYMQKPAMVKLDIENAKVTLTFSNQTLRD